MSRTEVVLLKPHEHELDPVLVVEAALFSAGKPLSVEELAENAGLDKRKVVPALKALKERYDAHPTALEIGKVGADRWAMQVRATYTGKTTRFAPMEIPIKLVKTLALIAYHQPILQSDLKEMVGDKVYDHIRELQERGLVRKRAHERSYHILTTDRFPDYFGIPAGDREGIKHFLADKMGLKLPKTDEKGNVKLNAFQEGDAAPAPVEPKAEEKPAAGPSQDAA